MSVTSFSFTSFFYWKKCSQTWFVSACLSATLLHDTEPVFVSLTHPTTHHPILVINAYGAQFLLCSTWIGSSAFIQFAPMSSPTDTFSSRFSWQTTSSKYFHCFSCPCLVMSSLSTGSSSLMNVVGKGTHWLLLSLVDHLLLLMDFWIHHLLFWWWLIFLCQGYKDDLSIGLI